MVKRIKKAGVEPGQRREWLRRYESGESPAAIAKTDHFDVRTVRKHIALAKMESEGHEARTLVLRNALEEHYRDLCKLAAEIDVRIGRGESASVLLGSRLYIALRQHMRGYPLLNKLDDWENTLAELAKTEQVVSERIKKELKADSRLDSIPPRGREEVIEGLVEILTDQFHNRSRGNRGLKIDDAFRVEAAEIESVHVQYGRFRAKVPEANVGGLKQLLSDFESEISRRGEWSVTRTLLEKLASLKEDLQDELAVITMRRILPGRCKYCPF